MEQSGIELDGAMRTAGRGRAGRKPAARWSEAESNWTAEDGRSKICTGGWQIFMNYTYIVRCSDGTLYTGWTNNLEKRIKDHNDGKGAKYTKPRRPVVLVYYEEFSTKEEAMRREWEIKQMSRRDKLAIVEKG